jgi:type II secretory pathway predicted ATPase ExeA
MVMVNENEDLNEERLEKNHLKRFLEHEKHRKKLCIAGRITWFG